eukprot:4912499-Prymnesium_polylepis.1
MTTRSFPVRIDGLQPDTKYTVAVRSHPRLQPTIAWGPGWAALSEPAVCTTASAGAVSKETKPSPCSAPSQSRFLKVYRISEYSFDVDFLANHDAADADSMPLYLMTCDPMGVRTPRRQSAKAWECTRTVLRSPGPRSLHRCTDPMPVPPPTAGRTARRGTRAISRLAGTGARARWSRCARTSAAARSAACGAPTSTARRSRRRAAHSATTTP